MRLPWSEKTKGVWTLYRFYNISRYSGLDVEIIFINKDWIKNLDYWFIGPGYHGRFTVKFQWFPKMSSVVMTVHQKNRQNYFNGSHFFFYHCPI